MFTLEELASIVETRTRRGSCSLYRDLYGLDESQESLRIATREEWLALPFLHKELLIDTPIDQRIFVDYQDIDVILSSSGTSGKMPLFSPRTNLSGWEHRESFFHCEKPILSAVGPPHRMEFFMRAIGSTPRVITLDPKRIRACVRLAYAAGVETLSVHAFLIPAVGKEMTALGMNGNIKCIDITGEVCSRDTFELIRSVFPNAMIIDNYGSSEVECSPMGIPCRPITGEAPLEVFHAGPGFHFEIYDPDTNSIVEPSEGAEGELIITAYQGEPSAFPMIRYRIGDRIRVVDTRCSRHGDWTFEVLGRAEMDFIVIPGGQLRADEISRVLTEVAQIPDRFEMHVHKQTTMNGIRIAAILHLDPSVISPMATDLIARSLRVGPSYTYAQGVEEGLYMPLVCMPLNVAREDMQRKHQRMYKY